MEGVRSFLETSSIHGLGHISTSRSYFSKLFWIIVVVTGFTGAGVLIYQSFQSWSENPVTTTLDTRPITEITLPKVTVCPPKNTFTDLNYDLIVTENKTLDDNTISELTNIAMDVLYDHLYETIITRQIVSGKNETIYESTKERLYDHYFKMASISMLEDNDMYYNWYHGYTQIYLPHFDADGFVNIIVNTAAKSGTISTKYFGDKYEADKVETLIRAQVNVHPPKTIQNTQATLNFHMEQESMKNLITYEDKYYVNSADPMNGGKRQLSQNYSQPDEEYYYVKILRNVTQLNAKDQKLSRMPGFKFTWGYYGMEVKSEAKYSENEHTLAFVR